MWSVVNNYGGSTLVCIRVFFLLVVASDHGSRVSTLPRRRFCHGVWCGVFQIMMVVLIRVAFTPHFGSKSSICSSAVIRDLSLLKLE